MISIAAYLSKQNIRHYRVQESIIIHTVCHPLCPKNTQIISQHSTKSSRYQFNSAEAKLIFQVQYTILKLQKKRQHRHLSPSRLYITVGLHPVPYKVKKVFITDSHGRSLQKCIVDKMQLNLRSCAPHVFSFTRFGFYARTAGSTCRFQGK